VVSEGGKLTGTLTEKVFLGNQWLLRVATVLGEVLVLRRNAGRREGEHGETIHLDWNPEHLRILPIEPGVRT
jgi:putative spermidine/putrescine transport system ATP-binding protein